MAKSEKTNQIFMNRPNPDFAIKNGADGCYRDPLGVKSQRVFCFVPYLMRNRHWHTGSLNSLPGASAKVRIPERKTDGMPIGGWNTDKELLIS